MSRWIFVFILAVAAALAGYLRFFTPNASWWMDTVFVALLAGALIAFIVEWKRVLQIHHDQDREMKK